MAGAARPRVEHGFRSVPDLERDEKGNAVWSREPAFVDARAQFSREHFVAVEEAKMLREELSWCYLKEGVNHYENCKHLADAYLDKISRPHFGMLRGGTRF